MTTVAKASQPPPYRPSFPASYRPGVGIIGCGHIVKLAHLPAYTAYGVNVIGIHDASAEAVDGIQSRFPVIGRVFESVGDLLADSRIDVVDIATHPAARRELIAEAIDAGKHVLSQKPFAVDLASARDLVERAERKGVRLAVNQNGRWAPPWRIATLLIEQGRVGEVCAVTHLFEHDFDWTVGTPYDNMHHFVLYDFAVHWLDITRCWMHDKTVATVSAREYRTPAQQTGQKAPWRRLGRRYTDGSSAVIRSIGVSTRRPGDPFWVHGTDGTIRGSIRQQTDFVELERDGASLRYSFDGEWLPDGFAGTMGELCSAIAEDREPFNSARHNLLTLEMTLAACRSVDEGGRPVVLGERSRPGCPPPQPTAT